jgi:CDGSH-type Zn-finger protein/truncated hemoglobin YjbI
MATIDGTSVSNPTFGNLAAAKDDLCWLFVRASELASAARKIYLTDREVQMGTAANRLTRSVARPLGAALARLGGDPGALVSDSDEVAGSGALDIITLRELIWKLAHDATKIRLRPGLPTEVQEATAALQDLVVRLAPTEEIEAVKSRVSDLRQLMTELPRGIELVSDGPYVATNVETLSTWLGEPIDHLPQMALCRCGASELKPFCDGSHFDAKFVDEKDPKRIPDRRDTHVGLQLTVFDNRGICQHSGFCTDRLSTVFRQGQEPFVAPSAGRMDEIIRAVRDCPSGALGVAMDGHEERGQVDWHGGRAPSIEVSKDGPYRITGGITLADSEGGEVERNQGVSLEHYALCRCGHSQNKPFCSGMHWYVKFRNPTREPGHEPTIFEWCGGLPALVRMARIFYEKHVPEEPLLAPLFGRMEADHPQRVAKWLAEVFGGPKLYSEEYGGYTRMIGQHIGKGITEEMRSRWATLMAQSASEAGMPNDPEFRSLFSSYIEWGSRLAVENSQSNSRPPMHMPMPHWSWNTAAGPPGTRISALPNEDEAEAPAPVPEPLSSDEQPLFERHVKPLFRRRDQQSMQFVFDLWSYEDVKQHAQAILERLANGSMPCDGAWPREKVEMFRRWLESGMRK